MSIEVQSQATDGTSTNSISASTPRYAAVKRLAPVAPAASAYTAYFYTPMPSQLAGKQVLSAYVDVLMDSSSGSRTMSLVRHAKSKTPYTKMTHNNKPATLSGATSHAVTQSGTTTAWRYDVTSDLQAIAAGGAYYGWKLSSTFTSTWKLHAWQSYDPPLLTVVLSEDAGEPLGLRPDGVIALAKPVLTWNPLSGTLAAQAQIDSVGDDFTSPIFDTGTIATTEGQIDLATTAYAGLADAASVIVRVRQTTDAGVSVWSDTITMTRDAYGALAITGPATPSSDPTPALTWTFAAQARYQVTVSKAGKAIADSGVLAGADTAWAPTTGATASGDVLTYRLRTWDAAARTSSPGDPGYVEATTAITYTPGAGAAVSSLSVTQDGVKPWVDLDWTRAAGVPDEWLIIRDDVIVARFDGISGGSPVLTYRDYAVKPNVAQSYTVRPVIAGAAGAAGYSVPVTPKVTGAWVVNPATGENFSVSGAPELAYAESTVLYEPVGGSAPTKRTFALRGLEGTVSGAMEDYDGLTVATQEADLYAIKASSTDICRYVCGDINIPAVIGDLTTLADADRFRLTRNSKQVSFSVRQAGELPFPEIVP